jgi:ABC-type transport system substrate-binding protein
MLPIGVLGVDKAMNRQQDLGKAKQLLTEAGFPNGFTVKLSYLTAPLLGVASEPLAANSRPTWLSSALG